MIARVKKLLLHAHSCSPWCPSGVRRIRPTATPRTCFGTPLAPLILSSFLFSPSAQADTGVTTPGDWKSGQFPRSGIQYAMTTNHGDQTAAGILCVTGTKQCVAILDTGNQCAKDSTIPLLVNSAQEGSAVLEGSCQTIRSRSFLVLSEFSVAKEIFESKKNIQFALPLKNGSYQLIHFSTKGAKEAISAILPGITNKKSINMDTTTTMDPASFL